MALLTARAIAELVNGELKGEAETIVESLAPLNRAGPTHVSFLASPKYLSLLPQSKAGVLLVDPTLSDSVSVGDIAAIIVVSKPHDAVLSLLPHLYDIASMPAGISSTAVIGKDVKIGEGVRIEDFVVIGDGVIIGDNSRICSHVTLYPGAVIGKRCIINSGVRLGSDGFGYVFKDGAHNKIPHVGKCIVEDDVEIGVNSTIDRGSIDDTVIGAGTKIDNLVHIAHNVKIGKLCLLMAQVGVAGSTHLGDGVILAGQVGVSGHVDIGDGARLAAQAGVFGDIPAGETWSGYPARPHRESLRASGALFKLPNMIRKLEKLLESQEK